MTSPVPRVAGGSPRWTLQVRGVSATPVHCLWGRLKMCRLPVSLPCARNPFPRPFSDVYFTGKTLLYGREIVTLCHNDSSPRKQKDELAYGKRPTGPRERRDTVQGMVTTPLFPVLRSRDHGQLSALALAWAQARFEFERHCILLNSSSRYLLTS